MYLEREATWKLNLYWIQMRLQVVNTDSKLSGQDIQIVVKTHGIDQQLFSMYGGRFTVQSSVFLSPESVSLYVFFQMPSEDESKNHMFNSFYQHDETQRKTLMCFIRLESYRFECVSVSVFLSLCSFQVLLAMYSMPKIL